MSQKIIFRADGNSSAGLGHLYRAFALIEMLKSDFDVLLITRNDSTLNIIPSAYKTAIIPISISLQDEPNWLNNHYNAFQHIVILDGYQFGESYQNQLKSHKYKLVYIDDLALKNQVADIIINHSPSASEKSYSTNSNIKLALGLNYAILRPPFLSEAQKNVPYDDNSFSSALVCFGGADVNDFTFLAAKALTQIKNIKKINIIIGGAYQSTQLIELTQQYAHINIHKNLTESSMFLIMKQCDFAIVSASTILLECLALQKPTLAGYYVENQKYLYHYLTEHNITTGIGDLNLLNWDEFALKIGVFLNTQHMPPKIIDGFQKDRIIKLITHLTDGH
jgi:UDP-2,4-diacetamido-2,4,6-trideoxy-beta-L-altropyranose hydrolase